MQSFSIAIQGFSNATEKPYIALEKPRERGRNRPLSLYTCRAALGEGAHLLDGGHRRVAGEGRQQRAVRPAELERLLGRLAREQAVEEARGEAVAAADAVEHVELRGRGDVRLAVDPGHRAPAMTVRRVHLAQGRGDDLDVGVHLHHLVDHAEEGSGVELRGLRHVLPRNAEALLQVLLVADEHVNVLDDARHGLDRAPLAARNLPELLAEVQVERSHGARGLRRPHRFNDDLGRRLRQRREDAARVEPAHAAREYLVPVEVARLQERGGLVRAVVEDDGGADAVAAVAVDGGEVGAAHAVVLEPLVEGLDAHRADALLHEVADGVGDHRRDDAGVEAEAVGEVGRAVELAARDVYVAARGLAEGDDAGVDAVDERAQRDEVERAFPFDVQTVTHLFDSPCNKRAVSEPPAVAGGSDLYVLNPAEGREAAVNRNHDAGDEAGRGREEPQKRPQQVLGLAEAAHRRVRDDGLPALRERAGLLVRQQEAVLLRQEEAGRDGVDADRRAVLGGEVDGEPLREAVDARLRRRVAEHARQGADGAHRRDVEDDALALLRHPPAEDLTGDDGAEHVQVEDEAEGLFGQVEELLLRVRRRAGVVAAR